MGWDEPTETKTIAAHFNGDEYTESSFGILYKDLLTQGTEGAICQLPDTLKGADANGYI